MSVVKIDFTGSTSPPTGWNSISGPTTTGVRIADLLDDAGAATGVSIEQVKAYDGSLAPGLSAGDHHGWPNSVWSEAWFEDTIGAVHAFTLSGLTSGKTVTAQLAGFRGSSRNTNFQLRDSSGTLIDSATYVDPSGTTPNVQATVVAEVPGDGILRIYYQLQSFFAYLTGLEFEIDDSAIPAPRRRRIVSVIG